MMAPAAALPDAEGRLFVLPAHSGLHRAVSLRGGHEERQDAPDSMDPEAGKTPLLEKPIGLRAPLPFCRSY